MNKYSDQRAPLLIGLPLPLSRLPDFTIQRERLRTRHSASRPTRLTRPTRPTRHSKGSASRPALRATSFWPINPAHDVGEIRSRFTMRGPFLCWRPAATPGGLAAPTLAAPTLAGHLRRDIGRVVSLDGHSYLARDLAWVLQTGQWPRAPLQTRGATGDLRRDNLQETGALPHTQRTQP